jgi:hypothetical protein
MAQKTAEVKNSFSRGALDPELYERQDLEHYYLAAKTGLNVVTIPQGGFKQRPGSLSYSRLRRRLAPVSFSATQVTAFNGGTVANLVDQDPTTLFTTTAVSGSPFVLFEVDFSAPVTISFVDLINFSSASAQAQRCLAVEFWTGSAWAPLPGSGDPTLSPYRSISSTARSRRFGGAPGQTFTARQWRVTLYATSSVIYSADPITNLGAISVGGLRFWQETSVISNVRLIPFAKSVDDVFQLVLSDRNIDIFKMGAFCASVPVPVANEFVRQCKFEQSLDTLVIFHKDIKTLWIQKQGARDEWNAGYQAYTNIPALSSNTSFSGNANEVQQLNFQGLTVGAQFVVAVGDMLSNVITYSTPTQLIANLASALDALPGITSALNIVVQSSSPLTLLVAFVNANGSRRWPPISFIPLAPLTVACVTTIVQKGINASGPIMDETTGWPSCGVIHQSRLMLGGFRGAPSTWLMSRAGNFIDFTLTGSPMTADMGIQGTIDSDDVEEILHIYIGQRLQIFTTRGEWWSDNTTFDATKTTDVILATRYGAARNILPVFVQNGTLFVQDGGQNGAQANTVVRDFVYDWQINNYTSEPISLLGGHQFTNIVAMAHRAGVTTKDASLIFFANADGSLAILTLLKSQDITGITTSTTPGQFVDVAVDMLRYAWAICQRSGDNWLELFDDTTYLDAAVSYPGPAASVSLPLHLQGQQVYAFLDGDVYGPLPTSGATLTLPKVATSQIVIGLWSPVEIDTLPWRPDPKKSQPWRKLVRIYMVELSLLNSVPVQISANGNAFIDAPMRYFDGGPLPQEVTGEEPTNDFFDVPMMQRLFSGKTKLDGLKGWTRQGIIKVRQAVPGPITLRSIRYEIAWG